MTPRQLLARLKLARRRERHRLAARLGTAALAARGDAKELKRQLKRLTRD
jgi:hypothetical protein